MKHESHIQYMDDQIWYSDVGSGETIVFLHGWKINKETWDSIVQRFVKLGYRCICIDLPGFGKSTTEHAWNLEEYAAAILHTLEQLDIRECTLVGHSFGAKCAAMVAAADNSPVRKLVLVSANFGLARRNIFWLPIHYALRLRLSQNMERTYRLTHGKHFGETLKKIHVPVLLMHGTFDSVASPRNSINAMTFLQNAKLTLLKTWHMPYRERPSLFVAELDSFIKS